MEESSDKDDMELFKTPTVPAKRRKRKFSEICENFNLFDPDANSRNLSGIGDRLKLNASRTLNTPALIGMSPKSNLNFPRKLKKFVSQFHCLIVSAHGSTDDSLYQSIDISSRGSTYINQKLIEKGVWYNLKEGDEISLGRPDLFVAYVENGLLHQVSEELLKNSANRWII